MRATATVTCARVSRSMRTNGSDGDQLCIVGEVGSGVAGDCRRNGCARRTFIRENQEHRQTPHNGIERRCSKTATVGYVLSLPTSCLASFCANIARRLPERKRTTSSCNAIITMTADSEHARESTAAVLLRVRHPGRRMAKGCCGPYPRHV